MSNRKNKKSIRKHSTSVLQKRSIGDMTIDLIQFLESLPAFSFVFLGGDRTCATGPSLASAVDLVCCATEGWEYAGPHPASQFQSFMAEGKRRLPEIVEQVREHVGRLRAAGVSFILCWHAHGEQQPHLEWYGDYSPDAVREELFCLLQDEVGCYAM